MSQLPELQNTDGDPLLATVDHFGFDPQVVRFRAREHSDPVARLKQTRARSPKELPGPPPSDEVDGIILEMKTRHYAGWADDPLPALGGRTPREAVRTRSERQRVDLLIKENENLESRMPPGQRFDFGDLRRELGLEE